MWIGMNNVNQRILVLLKQQGKGPEKFRPEIFIHSNPQFQIYGTFLYYHHQSRYLFVIMILSKSTSSSFNVILIYTGHLKESEVFGAKEWREIQEQSLLVFRLPKSSIIQWNFSVTLALNFYAKINSIPFPRKISIWNFRSSQGLTNHWQKNWRRHVW